MTELRFEPKCTWAPKLMTLCLLVAGRMAPVMSMLEDPAVGPDSGLSSPELQGPPAHSWGGSLGSPWMYL